MNTTTPALDQSAEAKALAAAAQKAIEDEAASTKDAKPNKAAAAQAAADKLLITVVKLGHEDLRVHPSCVSAHQMSGWTVKLGA